MAEVNSKNNYKNFHKMLQNKKKKIDPSNFFQMNEQNCPRNYNSYLKSTDTDKKRTETILSYNFM